MLLLAPRRAKFIILAMFGLFNNFNLWASPPPAGETIVAALQE
jgi:hypothetical protein